MEKWELSPRKMFSNSSRLSVKEVENEKLFDIVSGIFVICKMRSKVHEDNLKRR
jgi:hypothetical protein